jgi:hypothetical protein
MRFQALSCTNYKPECNVLLIHGILDYIASDKAFEHLIISRALLNEGE